MRWTHFLDLHIAAPVGGGGDGAGVRPKSNQGRHLPEALATELPEIQFVTHRSHLGETRIADMRVMRPNDRLRPGSARFEQMLQRLEHMRISKIPRLRAAVVHDPVIALGRSN